MRKNIGVNVKAAIRVAVDVLPPESGFFFGTEDVDEWYWQDLEHTVKVVNRCEVLDAQPNEYWDFEYQSAPGDLLNTEKRKESPVSYPTVDPREMFTPEETAAITAGMVPTHVVVCLGGLSVHVNGSPMFGCLVYGPFTEDEVAEKAKEIQRLEGGAILVRPLVDLANTYRRISAD